MDFQSAEMADIGLSTVSGAMHLEPSSDAQADDSEDASNCFA